jgi:hypothetical protein
VATEKGWSGFHRPTQPMATIGQGGPCQSAPRCTPTALSRRARHGAVGGDSAAGGRWWGSPEKHLWRNAEAPDKEETTGAHQVAWRRRGDRVEDGQLCFVAEDARGRWRRSGWVPAARRG